MGALQDLLDLVPEEYRFLVPLCLGILAVSAYLKSHYEKNVAEAPVLHYLPTEANRYHISRSKPLYMFRPTPWAIHYVLQTIFGYAMRRAPNVEYRTQSLEMQDGGDVALDWLEDADLPADAPVVVIFHGIAGDSSENYIRSFCTRVLREHRWRCVVYNRRGHKRDMEHSLPKLTIGESQAAWEEGSPTGPDGTGGGLRRNRSDRALHTSKRSWPRHGDTSDSHEVVEQIAREYPHATLLAVGYSAGSNILVKYLGEAGADTPIRGAVSVCNAYDLVTGTKLFAKYHPYWDWYLTRSLRGLAKRHWELLEQILPVEDRNRRTRLVRKASSVRDLDANLATALYGYGSVDEYYADSHCKDILEHIQTRTLLLNSKDDPICHPNLLEYPINAAATNDSLIVAITNRGGHMGWLQGLWPSSWYEEMIVEFLQGFVPDIRPKKRISVKEPRRPALGRALAAVGHALGGLGTGGARERRARDKAPAAVRREKAIGDDEDDQGEDGEEEEEQPLRGRKAGVRRRGAGAAGASVSPPPRGRRARAAAN